MLQLDSVTERPMIADSIRVALIDDHRVLLDSMKDRINQEQGFTIVGSSNSTEEALEMLKSTAPDVLLCDIEMPGKSVFAVIEDAAQFLPNLKVVILTGYLADAFVEQVIRNRLSGYLMKGEPIERILDSIRRVTLGEQCFFPEVLQRLHFDSTHRNYVMKNPSVLSTLTGRQLEVMRLLAQGSSVKEVAKQLSLSEKSVDSHKYRLMYKLGIHDRVELTRLAIREGLMFP